jgi:hypothetical protein
MITPTPTSPEGNERYRKGLCVHCGLTRYSAGRPRCNQCHAVWLERIYGPPPPTTRDNQWTDDFIDNLRRAGLIRERGRTEEVVDNNFFTADVAQAGTHPRYVEAAIGAELQRLADATEGTRNHTLYCVACKVFEFVKGGHADQAGARAELQRLAAAIGLPDSEIRATLESAWRRVGPRNVPAPHSQRAAS